MVRCWASSTLIYFVEHSWMLSVYYFCLSFYIRSNSFVVERTTYPPRNRTHSVIRLRRQIPLSGHSDEHTNYRYLWYRPANVCKHKLENSRPKNVIPRIPPARTQIWYKNLPFIRTIIVTHRFFFIGVCVLSFVIPNTIDAFAYLFCRYSL